MIDQKMDQREEKAFEGGFQKSVYQSLDLAFRPYALQLGVLFILGFVGRFLLLGNVNFLGRWIDQGTPNPQDFLLFLLFCLIAGAVLTLVFRVGFSRTTAKAVSQIYDEVMFRTSRFPMKFFDDNPVGRVVTRFASDYGNVFRLFGGPLAEFFSIVFDLVLISILMLMASWKFLPILLLLIGLNFAVYRFNQLKLREARRTLSSSRSPSVAFFAESLQGPATIRAFQKEDEFSEHFAKLDDLFLKQKKSTFRKSMNFFLEMNALTAFILLISGLASYFLLEKKLVSSGDVGVLLSLVVYSGNSLQMFFDWANQFEEALVSLERLNQYLRSPIEPGAELPVQTLFETGHRKTAVAKPQAAHPVKSSSLPSPIQLSEPVRIELKDLWFRYSANLPWLLQNLNLVIEPKEKLGVIGKTGSGKSTLVQVLFHLYPYEKGQVFLNGHTVNLQSEDPTHDDNTEVSLDWLRQHISCIPQDPVLFAGTLKSNLDLEGVYDEPLLFDVLQRVGLERFASADGLRLPIDSQGKGLSMGERQLICLARCLLRPSSIIVMDEATSNVDSMTEQQMVRASEELFADRTQIIIAHRLSTLKSCDRILWLDHGKVQMLGPAEEVLHAFQSFVLSEEDVSRETPDSTINPSKF